MVLSSSMINNILFRPPEFEFDEVCPKGDIWSFGTLILYMLSAINDTTPFYKIKPLQLLHDRIETLLNNFEDALLKTALLKMIVDDPSLRIDAG